MSGRSTRSQYGFTYFELSLAMSIGALVLLLVGAIFASSDRLVRESSAQVRAAAEGRRGLNALVNTLRPVALDTLGGFDAQGRSTSPTFQRVIDDAYGEGKLGDVARLEWRSMAREIQGVDSPGAVFLVEGPSTTLVADRVPKGGFDVVQSGRHIVLRLTTYQPVEGGPAYRITSETAATVRN